MTRSLSENPSRNGHGSIVGQRSGVRTIVSVLCVLIMASAACSSDEGDLPDGIKLPPGFHISIYAKDVPKVREMVFGADGTLFAGSFAGDVYAVVDKDKDYKADRVITIARGLQMPVGVDFRDGSLYVSAVSRILRFDRIESRLDSPPEPVVVSSALPAETSHGWKFIRFGPDGKLYVPVGAPCNVCKEKDERYACIMRMNADGSGLEIFARGVRNTVGFDWHPQTKELWFTDNGRDWMGDDRPPDELNRAPGPGLHFGFPFCHGGDIPDPKFGKEQPCSRFTPPETKLGPHVASLGMRFYTGSMFPPEYKNQIFIAEHGSWNRSRKTGYRITLVRLEDNRVKSSEVFAEGWLEGWSTRGRPADVEVAPDGSLFVSDDYAHVIYRITYNNP